MSRRPIIIFFFLFLLILGCAFEVAAQSKVGTKAVYAEIERRIESSDFIVADRLLMQLAIDDPKDVRTLELLARLRLRQGRLDESNALYKRVLGIEPGNPSARINSSRISFAGGDRTEAQTLLDGVSHAELSPALRLELAAAYLLMGSTVKALAIAEDLPTLVRNSLALPLFGEIYLRLERWEALRALIPSMRLIAAKETKLAVRCAEVLRGAGMFKDAISLLTAVPAVRRDSSILIALSRLEIITGDLGRAKQHLQTVASKTDHSSPELFSLQAYLESASGNKEAAIALISKARDLAPKSPVILADFVALTLRLGKPVLAFDAAQILAEIEPRELEYQYLLGVASLQSGNFDPAESTLRKYVAQRPADFRGCLALGMVFAAQNGRFAVAQEQLAKCNDIDPTNIEARYQLALSYRSQGDNARAQGLLEQVVERAPDRAQAFRDLGALYLESGDDAKARISLERAAALAPKDGDTHFQLARLYNRLGETVLAKKHQEIFQSLRGVWGKNAQ